MAPSFALALTLTMGCNERAPPPAAAVAPSELATLLPEAQIWPVRLAVYARGASPVPRLRLSVVPFEGELATAGAVQVDGPHELVFLPVVYGPMVGNCTVELDARVGDERRRLWSGTPRFVAVGRGRLANPAVRLGSPESVTIDPGEGPAAVELLWRLKGPCAAREAGLSQVALRPMSADERPSILFVCSDTHRFDHSLGERGRELMPRFHRWSEEAVVYPRAFANASWTLPSIASTLTGIFPRHHRTGMRIESGRLAEWDRSRELSPGQFFIGWGEDYHVFSAYPDSLDTLAVRLGREGYRTAAVVANVFYASSGLLGRGVDVFFDTGAVDGSVVNRMAFDWLSGAPDDRPLFLLVHYLDVHEWLHRGAPRAGSQKTTDIDREETHRRYAEQVRKSDVFFSRLIAAWDQKVGSGRSLVVFYSDHGEHLKEPGRPSERHGDSMDEVLMHIPLVVRYPESAGRPTGRDGRPVSLIDLVPTALAVAGISAEGGTFHGRSLLAEGTMEREIFADHQLEGDELSSVRAGSHKLVWNHTRQEKTLIETEGGDRRRPEAEWTRDDSVKSAALVRAFERYRAEADAFASRLDSSATFDAEELEERLRAIGYVE